MEEMRNIIDLWHEKSEDNLAEAYDKARKQMIENDYVVSELNKMWQDIVDCVKWNCSEGVAEALPILKKEHFITKVTELALEELYDDYNEMFLRLDELCDEIQSMYSECETYEQKMECLETYHVTCNKKLKPKTYFFDPDEYMEGADSEA